MITRSTITLRPDVLSGLETRMVGVYKLSPTIRTQLQRYFVLLRNTCVGLREKLTKEEIGLLTDALNGIEAGPLVPPPIVEQIANAVKFDALDEKWGVDRVDLLQKLWNLSDVEKLVLVDAVERWWIRVQKGESPEVKKALK